MAILKQVGVKPLSLFGQSGTVLPLDSSQHEERLAEAAKKLESGDAKQIDNLMNMVRNILLRDTKMNVDETGLAKFIHAHGVPQGVTDMRKVVGEQARPTPPQGKR